MWLTDNDSLCIKCVHLNHECEVECGDDYICIENCEKLDASAREAFYDFEYEGTITKCNEFEE